MRGRRGASRPVTVALAALVSSAASAKALRAQDIPPPALALVVGAAQYDLSGTGTVPFVALRLDLPMSEHLYVEPGFAYMAYSLPVGDRVRHVSAEIQLQGSLSFGRWNPYLGAGAGGFFDLRKQRGGADLAQPAFSGAGGVRVELPASLGARAELRIREIDTGFTGSVAEWGVGLSWSF